MERLLTPIHRPRTAGFSAIELIVAMVLIALVVSISYPRVRSGMDKSNVRAARVSLSSGIVTAREAAVARGCRAVVHFTSGAAGTVWVTACPRTRPGVGTVDTIGAVDQLAARYNVSITASRDSIQFDVRGLSLDNLSTNVGVQGKSTYNRDSTMISPLGKVLH